MLIAGAETWRTRTRVRAGGGKPDWTSQDDSVPMAPGSDEVMRVAGPAELRIKLDRPAYVYPMFEQALRIAAGEVARRTTAVASANCGRSSVPWPQTNPHAWNREPLSAQADLASPGPTTG